MELTYGVTQTNWTKINDYNIKTNRCKTVKQYRELNEGSPTTIRRVYRIHQFQGNIRFRLTLRAILQLIRQRSDRDCTRYYYIAGLKQSLVNTKSEIQETI